MARGLGIRRGLLIALVSALALPGAAEARIDGAVTIFSEPHDSIGGFEQQLYHSENARITHSFDGSRLAVEVDTTFGGPNYNLRFHAPRGEALSEGRYLRTDGPFTGVPGMDISGNGSGCTNRGEFEVKELEVAPDGTLERARVLFVQGCDSIVTDHIFGEVQIGAGTEAAPGIYPQEVRWPANDLLESGIAVPVTLIGEDGGFGVTGAQLAGPGTEHFRIVSDECSGRSIAAGGSCQIWVRHRPVADGGGSARLVIDTASGERREVPLDGPAFGGTTRLTIESEPGDRVGGGRTFEITPHAADVLGRGSPLRLGFLVMSPDEPDWYAHFYPPPGEHLEERTYPNAWHGEDPYNADPRPELNVVGPNGGCTEGTGQFTVRYVRYSAYMIVERLAIDFEQRCTGAAGGLRGTFEYRMPGVDFPGPPPDEGAPPPEGDPDPEPPGEEPEPPGGGEPVPPGEGEPVPPGGGGPVPPGEGEPVPPGEGDATPPVEGEPLSPHTGAAAVQGGLALAPAAVLAEPFAPAGAPGPATVSLGRLAPSRRGLRQAVRVSGPGRLDVRATLLGRGRIATARRTTQAAGLYRLALRPSRAVRELLARRGTARILVRATFTPEGGPPQTVRRVLRATFT